MAEPSVNMLFVDLLRQLHYTAWMQLGKVANPVTGKVERNLEVAKGTIDLLGALEEKSKGNLHADEEKLLTSMLLDLRMNYVEEAKRGDTETTSQEASETQPDEAGGTRAEGSTATSTAEQQPAAAQPDAPPPPASEGPEKT
jgi:hypothetical protein